MSNEINLSFAASEDHDHRADESSSSKDLHTLLKDNVFTINNLVKVLSLFLYFLVGCLVYGHYEGWTVGTTVSFTIVTMCTVGKQIALINVSVFFAFVFE
jgi:hypothetical protein